MSTQEAQKIEKVAPDGGYGWIIVLGLALFYGIIFSMGSVFGLLYQEKIIELELPAKEVATVISVSYAVGTTTGLVAAPLINSFGFRKVAIAAGVFHVLGKVLSAYANSYITFLLSYSIVEALGYGFGVSAHLVAMTTYFLKHRAKAAGIAMTLTGIGPIVYPLLVNFLLSQYGGHATILLVAAISLHTILAGQLLQPVKWHMRKATDAELYALKEQDPEKSSNSSVKPKKESTERSKSVVIRSLKKVVDIFDLTLILDKKFVNIVLGLSLSDFAELTFLTITPFVLQDKDYTNDEIATILSSMGIADMVVRFICPFIGDYFHQTPRVMFIYSLILFIISRTTIICATTYTSVLIGAILTGIARGLSWVYWNLVIPSYVPLDRFAAATGIQMITSGLILLSTGSSIGILRDATGDYELSIAVLNLCSGLGVVLWVIEMIYTRRKPNSDCKLSCGFLKCC